MGGGPSSSQPGLQERCSIELQRTYYIQPATTTVDSKSPVVGGQALEANQKATFPTMIRRLPAQTAFSHLP